MNSNNLATANYEELFKSLHEAYVIFKADDPEFTVIDENETHARLAMVKRNDVIGKPVLEAFPDTSEEYQKTGESQLIASFRKVIQTRTPDTMPHLKYDLKDQKGHLKQKFWSVTHYPLIDKTGNVTAVYQATEDITEKVQAEQKLELTEYQLEQALLSGSIGTWYWDIKNKKVYADKNTADIFGLTAADTKAGLVLDAFVASVHPADRSRVAKEINKALEKRSLYESEYRTIDINNDVRWVIARGRVEVDNSNAPIRFSGIMVDITERKNAESNLNFLTQASTVFASSLDYKKTLNNIASMVVPTIADWCAIELVDDNGQIEQVAVAHKDPKKVAWAKELRSKQGAPNINDPTGLPLVLRTGKTEYYPAVTDEMLVAAAEDEEELKLIRSLGFNSVIITPLKVGSKTIGAISFVSTESKVHYKPSDVEFAKALANRAAMAVENSNLYMSAQHEIKERKRLQRQLETLNRALEDRIKKRTKQLEVTNQGLEAEIARRHKIEDELHENSRNLARSNQELQDFAYVASHDLQEPLRKIQAFGDLLENEYGVALSDGKEYLERMRSAAARMSILIADLLSFSRVTTKGQVDQEVDLNTIVRDVISDLENRIERTEGTVKVTHLPEVLADPTHMRQLFQNLIGNALKFHKPGVPPVVKVSAKQPKKGADMYEIVVQDNGIGFDEKYLDRIFSVFQRLHGKDSYEGTGIGLAVCRKIAERYGGTITAASKKGDGSTFIFKIPVSKDSKGKE